MLKHVVLRAKMYKGWSRFVVAICDHEIEQSSVDKGYPVVMTGKHLTRALDRVTEAVTRLDEACS